MNLKAHHTEHFLILVFFRVRIVNIQFIVDVPQEKMSRIHIWRMMRPRSLAVTLPPKTVLTQLQLFAA